MPELAQTVSGLGGELGMLPGSGVTFVTGVADSVFGELIAKLEAEDLDHGYLRATREDNAVALAVGAHLAGEHPLVFMESAGVGTSLDALTSLAITYEVPLVLLIAWAGYRGRDITHHNAIGEPLTVLLDALGVPFMTCDQAVLSTPALGGLLGQVRELAVEHRRPGALLVIPTDLADEVSE